MDIFNIKKVKSLESKIKELENQLIRANDFQPTVYVSKGDLLPLIVSMHLSDQGNEIPMEIVHRQLCHKLADGMFERNLVRYEVTDDPRTMSHIIHARIDVANKG